MAYTNEEYEKVIKALDRTYCDNDVSIHNIQAAIIAFCEDATLKERYELAYRLEAMYPKREGHILSGYQNDGVITPMKLKDTNDYELMADYSRDC